VPAAFAAVKTVCLVNHSPEGASNGASRDTASQQPKEAAADGADAGHQGGSDGRAALYPCTGTCEGGTSACGDADAGAKTAEAVI
jgi:hypothetical protein